MGNKTMNALNTYDFDNGGSIRTVTEDKETWFVLRDVLASMESLTRPADAKLAVESVFGRAVVRDYPLQTAGGLQRVACVKEEAVTYIVSRSNTEVGKRLNRWLHSEVLPSIRKTGSYGQSSDVAELKQMIANLSEKIDNMQTVKPLPAPSNMIRVKDINEILGGFYTSHKVNMALMMVGFQTRYHNGRQNQWLPTRKAKKYCATVGYGLSWNEQFIKDNLEAIENALANI